MKNKVLTAVLSVVIAFGLWLYVVTVVSPESKNIYYDIPVIYQNDNVLADRGLMITSDTPKVTLQLSGNRTDLVNLNEANIKLLVNVASIEAPGSHLLGYTVSLPGNIPNNSVTKQLGVPDLVTLKVEKKVKKNVDVKLEYIGAVPDNFIADKENAALDHASIEVSGPESVVDQIKQAVVQVDLNDQSKTIVGEYMYTLCNEKGEPVDSKLVTTNVEKVNLTVKIQKVKEIALKVEVIYGGGATEKTCTVTTKPNKIRVSGSDTLLDELDELILGTIDLREVPQDLSQHYSIRLPEGITNETGVNEALVEIRFPNLTTKVFSVTAILPQNVPEGCKVDMITQALEVKVRGPKERMHEMKDSDISVTVDFTGAELGTATIKANVAVSSQFPDAGAVGSYSVSATLEKAPEAKTSE